MHATPYRNVTLAMNEPIGVLGLVAPTEAPLLGFLSLVLPTVAMGNTVVAVPSVIGMMIGARIGARLLNVMKAALVRKLVLTLLLFSGLRALLKGLAIWN